LFHQTSPADILATTMLMKGVDSTLIVPYGDGNSELKEMPMKVVCTASAENWRVEGLSYNLIMDGDGSVTEGGANTSTCSPRFLDDKVEQTPSLQLVGFTSEERTDTKTDSPRFFLDADMIKQMFADGLDSAEGTDTSTCTPRIIIDVYMAQQRRVIKLAESVRQVRDLAVHACGFLRINGSQILDDTNEKFKRRGSVAFIRMLVQYLPSARGAKWHSSFLLSISVILQKNGCTAKVQDKRLFVPLVGGAWARIDFVASCNDKVHGIPI